MTGCATTSRKQAGLRCDIGILRICLVGCLLTILPSFTAHAADTYVGLNFGANNVALSPEADYSAGAVVSHVWWKNLYQATGSEPSVFDQFGNTVWINVTWSGFESAWYNLRASATNGDERMMWGFLDNEGPGPDLTGTIAVSNVVASSYDVYVYFGGGDGFKGTVGISGASTYSYSTIDAASLPSGYTNTTDTGSGYPPANYAVWSNLTASSFIMTFALAGPGANNGPSGMQLILHPVTVPTINNDGGAAVVLTNSAVLRGDLVTTGGQTTEVFVAWGTSDGGTVPGAWANVSDLGAVVPPTTGLISTNVGGLSPSTPYYYRFYATNASGEVWAPSSTSFTTASGLMYILNVAKNGSGSVSVTSDSFAPATDVPVTATPGSGYGFVSWSGDTNGCTFPSANSISVHMDHSRDIVANFGAISVVGLQFPRALNYNQMFPQDLAGVVVSSTNWNNILGFPDGSAGSIANSAGNVSGITVAWNGFEGVASSLSSFTNGDGKMMWGYVANEAGSAAIAVSNIPAGSYDVYVYFGSGGDGGDGNTGTIGIDGVSTYAYSTYGSATLAFPGIYTAATSIPGGAVSNNANYAVWKNMTASSFTATITQGSGGSGVCGIQLVLYSVPTPTGDVATNGVPISWLISHYGVTNDYNALALSDSDLDGAPAWKEYWAGTDPINPNSVFEILSTDKSGQDIVISWSSVTGEVYSVYRSTDLMAAWPITPLVGSISADLSGTNQYTDVNALTNGTASYRIRVQKL
jgi:hypothetical protein